MGYLAYKKFCFFSIYAYNRLMMCLKYMRRLLLISTFLFVFTLSVVCPFCAAEQIPGDAKKTGQTVSSGTTGVETKTDQNEFTEHKGLRYGIPNKYQKPQGASFIRLKPKQDNDSVAGIGKVFDIEFMDDESLEKKTKKDTDSGALLKLERIEDLDKKNSLIRKDLAKDYKTEVSMGLRVSPFSEIYIGKGFLLQRKDNLDFDPHDNGWRIKFKLDF